MIIKCNNCGAHVPGAVALGIVHGGVTQTFCLAQCADVQLRDVLPEIPPLPRRILVAVDGSGPSVRAVETAAGMALAAQGEIWLLTAIDTQLGAWHGPVAPIRHGHPGAHRGDRAAVA